MVLMENIFREKEEVEDPVVQFWVVTRQHQLGFLLVKPFRRFLPSSPSLPPTLLPLSLNRRALSSLPGSRLAAVASASYLLTVFLPLSSWLFSTQNKRGSLTTENTEREREKSVRFQANHNNDPVLTKIEWISQSILSSNEIRESAPTWVAAAWYLCLSSSGNIFPVSSPHNVEMAFLTVKMPRMSVENNGLLNARSPVPLWWCADS